jgi:predicted lipoprotein with Yx(FWY)xxD motif
VRIRSRLLPTIAATALVLAACGADDDPATDDTTVEDPADDLDEDPDDDTDLTDDPETDDNGADDNGADDDTVADDITDEDTAQDDADAAADGPVLSIATSDLGDHLVDAEGMTVYVNATGSTDEPACTGDCLGVWMPVPAGSDDPEVGDDVDAELVGVESRDDGVLEDGFQQLTYDDQLLYTFVVDTTAGDVSGQEIDASWFVVGPDGAPIGDVPEDTDDGADTEGEADDA